MKILGYDYKLDASQDAASIGAAGRCFVTDQRIQIANDLTPQQRESTVLHEVLEAISGLLELNLPHPTIAALETALYGTLTANGVSLRPLVRELRPKRRKIP